MVTHRKKLDYNAAAFLAIHQGRPWPAVGKRLCLNATLFVWAKMDRDNLVARLKWPIDCLVRYGILRDDNEKWLDLQMPKQVVDRKNPRVEIELTPCKSKEGE